jgi:hypothetical protein
MCRNRQPAAGGRKPFSDGIAGAVFASGEPLFDPVIMFETVYDSAAAPRCAEICETGFNSIHAHATALPKRANAHRTSGTMLITNQIFGNE